jgi:hypothetical protein
MRWPPLRSELQIGIAESGAPVLPNLILWAFRLNEGDLLTVAREESEPFRCRFESYARAVAIMAGWGDADPWHFIGGMLRLPMAAMGPRGELRLPAEAAALMLPGASLRLLIDPAHGEGFSLEPGGGWRADSTLFLEAVYVLPVEAGNQVRLPQEVLWALGLGGGDQLSCRTSPGTADFEPFTHLQPLAGRSLVVLGPEGALGLPGKLLRDLRPGWRILLSVTFNPKPALRMTCSIDVE